MHAKCETIGVSIEIVPFVPTLHQGGTIDALRTLRASGIDYPPQQDTDGSLSSLAAWLNDGPTIGRWVAVDRDAVLGYVQVTEPHDYILRHVGPTSAPSSLAEVGKLFVSTPAQGRGIGERLLSHARRAAASHRRQAVLAVLPTSEAAVYLYRRSGLLEIGTFVGAHGVNLVFRESTPEACDTPSH